MKITLYFSIVICLFFIGCSGSSTTSVPVTATSIPPTAIPVPPTATPVPPTATPDPPTATPLPPTPTPHTENKSLSQSASPMQFFFGYLAITGCSLNLQKTNRITFLDTHLLK